MKNRFFNLVVIAAASISAVGCASAVFAEAVEQTAPKLHEVTLTLDPADVQGVEVTGVGLKGEFLFYESNMTGHTDETGMADVDKYYPPSEYQEGMNFTAGMRK